MSIEAPKPRNHKEDDISRAVGELLLASEDRSDRALKAPEQHYVPAVPMQTWRELMSKVIGINRYH